MAWRLVVAAFWRSDASGASAAATSAASPDPSAQSNASTLSGDPASSSTYSYWQWHGVSYSGPAASIGSVAASSPYSSSASPFVGNAGTASLSGYVYVDANSNQMMDSGDWAIADATITLTKASSSTPLAAILSSQNGSYTFAGLAAGTYTVAMATPTNHPGQDSGQYRTVRERVYRCERGNGWHGRTECVRGHCVGRRRYGHELQFCRVDVSRRPDLQGDVAHQLAPRDPHRNARARAQRTGLARRCRAVSCRTELAPLLQVQALTV